MQNTFKKYRCWLSCMIIMIIFALNKKFIPMKILILSLFLFVFSIELYSQNIFFKENESGFHAAAQFSSSDGSTLFAIIPGYTLNGKLTFGLGLGFEENSSADLSSTAIRPFISYLALKQGNSNPVSVALNGGYQYNTFSDYDGLTAGSIRLGAGIFHQINVSNNFDLLPGGSVGWGRTTVKFQGLSESESAINYGLSLSGKFNKFYVTPSLTFSEGNSNFDLILGIIFPK